MTVGLEHVAGVEALESRAYFAGGGLDLGFGVGGQVVHTVDSPDEDRAAAVVVQADGKVLVAGEAAPGAAPLFAVERLNADGTLDASFGDGGRVRVVAAPGHVRAVALQADGKIVLAGEAASGGRFQVVRLNADGSADRTFGPLGDGVAGDPSGSGAVDVGAVAVLPNGKIFTGGSQYIDPDGAAGPAPGRDAAFFQRLMPDGRPDESYSSTGTRRLFADEPGTARVNAMKAQADGTVLCAGELNGDFMLMKLGGNGLPDASFGRVTTDFNGHDDAARALAVLADGTIVLAGESSGDFAMALFVQEETTLKTQFAGGRRRLRYDVGSATDVANGIGVGPDRRLVLFGTTGDTSKGTAKMAAVRFAARGRVDRTFGDGGRAVFDFGASTTADAGAVDAGGRVMLAGARVDGSGAADFAVARLGADGVLDASFGAGGRVIAPWLSAAPIGRAAAARQPDGRIVVAYAVDGHVGGRLGVTRFSADGSVDGSFGDGGTTFLPLGDGRIGVSLFDGGVATRVAVGPTGRIVVMVGGLMLAALDASGAPDGGFGTAGVATLDFGARADRLADLTAIAFQGERVVVAGRSVADETVGFARLTPEGRVDGTFGNDGLETVSFDLDPTYEGPPFPTTINAMAFDAGGWIVAAGVQGSINLDGPEPGGFALLRLTADGRLDAGFGEGGKVFADFAQQGQQYSEATAVAVLADGRIVAAGHTAGYARTAEEGFYFWGQTDFIAAAFEADGSADASFGDGGHAIVGFGEESYDQAGDVLVRADGRIVLGGFTGMYTGSPGVGFAVLTPGGALDASVGDGGRVVAPIATPAGVSVVGQVSPAALLVEQPGGRVVLVSGSGNALVLARLADGATPPLSARIEGGVLRVRGSAGDDAIRLRRAGDAVEVVGLITRFPAALFSRIEVDALAGDDQVDMSRLAIPAVIIGGDGDDVLLGGAADDSLIGGAGDDTLFGGRGRDTLRGGDGRDYLNGGPGADSVFGDAGGDQLFAVDGAIDLIFGGGGFDRAKGEPEDVLGQVEGVLE